MAPRLDFSQALALTADGGERLRYLGEAGYLCLYRGELDAAQAIFEGLIELVPDDPVGLLGAAEVELARSEPRKAEALARKAAERPGNSAETMALAYELWGKALLLLDRAAEAEKVLARAIEVAPDSPAAANARALPQLFRDLRAAISKTDRNEPGPRPEKS